MDEMKKRIDALEGRLLTLTKIVDKLENQPEQNVQASSNPQPEMENSMELLEKMQRRKKELMANKTVDLSLEEKRDKLKKLISSRTTGE